MHDQLVIHLNRTNYVAVGLAFDVSGETITSEIRSEKTLDSDLLATFTVEYATDGTDGELVLILNSEDLTNVTKTYGFMDLKRISGDEPLSIFSEPLKVLFQGVVTE